MRLVKVKIGDLISISNERNIEDKDLPFYGINKEKEFMPTIASVDNVDKSKYKIMTKGRFVFSGMQTGRDNCIRIGLYQLEFDSIVSPAYTTFEVTSKLIMPEYLFMIFKSGEMDRYGAFLSAGSIRANLDWDVFCGIEINLPNIEIQKKYLAIYKAMQHNLEVYKSGLNDLKLTFEMTILNAGKRKCIGDLIQETNEKNTNLKYNIEKGVSIQKQFIDTKASSSDLSKQKIVFKNEFAFNSNTSRNSDTLSIAYNDCEPYIVSNTYITFKCDGTIIDPRYLFIWFTRKEFDRYARFNSWGSARETISLEEIKKYKIIIPDLEKQKNIVKIYDNYIKRKNLTDKLKEQINNICPILIAGAVKEGASENE